MFLACPIFITKVPILTKTDVACLANSYDYNNGSFDSDKKAADVAFLANFYDYSGSFYIDKKATDIFQSRLQQWRIFQRQF